VIVGLGAASVPTQGAEITTAPRVGGKVGNFTLNDFYGKSHALADFKEKKVVVIAFLGTECPLAKSYGPRLAELQKKFADNGVQILGINSNRQDAVTEIAAYARVNHIEFPILKDLNNRVADQLGATRTPEVFVLDQDRVVRYHGRIDDQYGVGYAKKTVSEPYLRSAIQDLVAGKSVAKADTGVIGCFIGRMHAAESSAKVTYSNQVSRILNKRCVTCHRQGEIAPFAMTNYDEVSGWADAIAEVVRDRRMPPWFADPKYGHFGNDRSMPDEEKQVLYQWAAAGAPQGDPKELPAPPTFVDGWQLPKDPDDVFYMTKKPYSVPKTGVVDYQYFTVDPHFTEGKWLKGVEARPGNRAVVHHIIVFSVPKGAERNEGARQFLVGYAPGAIPLALPKGMAKYVPAGSVLLFQLHYTPNGEAHQTDRSKVGLVFADPKEITHLVRTVQSMNAGFEIPAGADNYEVQSDSFKFGFDSELLQLFPHMHLRGKSFKYEMRYPDGRSEVLLDVPRYDFGWQLTYELAGMRHMPKGTVMHCTAHFDNSENNLNNPDPKSIVRWGDQTFEEMMIGFYDIAIPISASDIEHNKLPDFSPGPEDIARSILDRFDKNHDGKVSQNEVPLDQYKVKLFLMQLDKNHNGEVTLEEATAFIKDRRKQGQGGGFRRIGRRPGNARPNADKPSAQKSGSKGDQASVTPDKK
jgi:peroxiredoxin